MIATGTGETNRAEPSGVPGQPPVAVAVRDSSPWQRTSGFLDGFGGCLVAKVCAADSLGETGPAAKRIFSDVASDALYDVSRARA